MKRFTVIVAMLALMLGTVAAANANLMTNPASGSDITTGWIMKGMSFWSNASSGLANSNHTAMSASVTMTQKTGDNWNMTASGSYYNGSTTVSFPISLFHNQWNTTVTKNSTFLATANGIGDETNVGSWKGMKMGATPDRSLYVIAGSKQLNRTNAAGSAQNNSAALFAMAQPITATTNRLAGTWKIFGYALGHNTTNAMNATYSTFVMGEMIVNSSKSQFGNATIFYKTSVQGGGFGAGYTVDRITLSQSGGRVTSGSGDFNWLSSAVLDASGNTLISAGNTTVGTGFGGLTGTSANATAMFIAVRAASDSSAGFTNLKTKKYTFLAAGTMAYNNATTRRPVNWPLGTYGVLDMNTPYQFSTGTSNMTVFNATSYLGMNTGNGSLAYGTVGLKDNAMGAFTIRTSSNNAISGANFTGAMRVDGQMYAGILSVGGLYQLAIVLPETSDAVINLSSLSSDFITDAQFLAATGLNQCPHSNASQTGACFELSHANYPTTGVNARQVNAITVSTYVQSVIDAADNASIMNTALLNATAKADSADYPGNFTSELYAGAPVELKSMYAFNGTSFQLNNASNNVRLLAKWVFVANGTGNGKVAGLTAEQADPWKYMKKYNDIKNATAYTKVYGNGTLQNWTKFWDADGNAAALADGTVFYTLYGTNASALAPLQKTDTFTSGTTYVLWAVLANGGLYDLDNSTAFVFDPPRIVTDEEIVISSSSSSGCVFNPVAGFGLEWLLLLLAPAVGIIRSRFRK